MYKFEICMFFVSYCILYVSCAHHLRSPSHRPGSDSPGRDCRDCGERRRERRRFARSVADAMRPWRPNRALQGVFPGDRGQTDTDLLNNMIHAKYTISASLVWFVSRKYCSTSNWNEGNKAKDIYDIYDEDSRHMAWEASLWHQLHVKCEIADTRRLIKQNQAKRDPKQRD